MINLEEGEYIVMKLRKHWWRIFCWGVGLVLAAFLPLLMGGLFLVFSSDAGSDKLFYIFGFFFSVWLTILWLLFFIEWTDYYLDVWVITNRRVVDIDHRGLFSRDVATVRLEDVEDTTAELHGFLPTLLKFGTITLQTAGSKNEFYMHNARDPEKAKQVIYGLIGAKRGDGQTHSEHQEA